MDWNKFYVPSSGNLNTTSNPSSIVNLFKLSKECISTQEKPKSPELDYLADPKYNNLFEDRLDTTTFVNYQKDLQLWDRDKSAVIDIVTKRLRNLDDSRSNQKRSQKEGLKQEKVTSTNGSDLPEVAMPSECEILISWLDEYLSDNERVNDEAQRIYVENAAKILTNSGLNPTNFLNFLMDIGKLCSKKSPNLQKYLKVSLNHLHRHAWGSLHISILNTKGVFFNSLVYKENRTPSEVLKTLTEVADLMYPGQSMSMGHSPVIRTSDYYFYLAYLLFRFGSEKGLEMMLEKKDENYKALKIDHTEVPPLFDDLCQILIDTLKGKETQTKQLTLEQFTTHYMPSDTSETNIMLKHPNYYAHLLLSLVYPDHYPQVDPSTLPTKEDYLWYQINLVLANSGTNLPLASYRLCNVMTQEVNEISSDDTDLVEKIFAYAYSMALAGGILESLRLMMSVVNVPAIQTFAVFFVVYYENLGLLEYEEIKYVSHTLWNLNTPPNAQEDLSYLVQLALNRKRKVSCELKILLSTMLPNNKNIMAVKYAVSENFSEAVNSFYMGTSVTKNGMLLVGPLLQKLIKLSTKRKAAKYAILLLAQYSAHVGLWAVSFKCFYCIQDVENAASVLEACCCYLYDNKESELNKTFTIEDISVYYKLLSNLAPNNKHVLELKNVFNCIELSVLVKNKEYLEAVNHCKKSKVFDNTTQILRNESHQIYFNALYSYITALKNLVSNGKQPSELLNSTQANNILDLLESAYHNSNTEKTLAVEALHLLLTFISVVPPK